MLGLWAALIGGLPFYSQSKYFPEKYGYLKAKVPAWLGILFLALSQAIYIWQMGLAKGLLTGFTVFTLAYSLLPFAFNLPKKYSIIFWGLMIGFFIIDIVY
jgi:hypothetical protein